MFNRFKSALINAVNGNELGLQYHNESDNEITTDYVSSNVEIEAKPYSRPCFLGLTSEETQVISLFYLFIFILITMFIIIVNV